MATGERIKHFRNLRGMTMKYLGQEVGFSESTADVRLAQYESGSRTPKADLIEKLAEALEVSPRALAVPDIDNYIGLAHTLFTLEDRYGLKVGEIDGEVCLRLDKSKGMTYLNMLDILLAWQEQAVKLIYEFLSEGREVSVEELNKEAIERGISERTVRMVRNSMKNKLESERRGKDWWIWLKRQDEAANSL